jgi:hypothetical protein
VCDDGSIFVDRDGEHFGHVLEYMRDGVLSVTDVGARPSVSLLRALKREFGFYCIELCAEEPVEPEQSEMAIVIGGNKIDAVMSSMERYDASSDTWSAADPMGTARSSFGACVVAGKLYVTGGTGEGNANILSSVERYSPSSYSWSTVALLPAARYGHASVAVGSAMFVLGGRVSYDTTASVLKFDSVQGTWSEVAPMPGVSAGIAACAVGSNILVFGGEDAQAYEQYTVFKYDTVADARSTLAPMPRAASGHSASMLNNLICIVGTGYNDTGNWWWQQ